MTSCFQISTANLILARSSLCAICTRVPMAITTSRSLRRDPRLRCPVLAAVALARPGRRAPSGDPGLAAAATGTAAHRRSKTGGAGLWPELSQSGRHGRRLRQERGGFGRVVAAGFLVSRNRDGDAEAASRQPAAAARREEQ